MSEQSKTKTADKENTLSAVLIYKYVAKLYAAVSILLSDDICLNTVLSIWLLYFPEATAAIS